MTPRLLTINDVAQLFQVNEALVRQWLKDGTLSGIKLGRSYRVRPESLTPLLGEAAGQKLYSIDDAARILKINRLTVYELVRAKKIASVRLGRLIRIPESATPGLELNETFYTIAETAKLCRVNAVSIRKLIEQKQLPALKIASLYRLPTSAIKRYTKQSVVNPLLDIKDIAAALQLSRLTVLKLIASKRLAAFKVGKLYRVTEEALQAYRRQEASTLTVASAAQTLKVSPALVRSLIAERDLKAKQIGRSYRIDSAALAKFLGKTNE